MPSNERNSAPLLSLASARVGLKDGGATQRNWMRGDGGAATQLLKTGPTQNGAAPPARLTFALPASAKVSSSGATRPHAAAAAAITSERCLVRLVVTIAICNTSNDNTRRRRGVARALFVSCADWPPAWLVPRKKLTPPRRRGRRQRPVRRLARR